MQTQTQTLHRPRQPGRRRLYILLGSAALLLTGLGFRQFWLARPVGAGPAGPPVSATLFAAQTWTERPVLLLGIGDSITAGFGASRAELSYFQRLVTNPDDEFADMRGVSLSSVLPNLAAENVAVSGSTSLQHLQIIQDLPPQPDDCLGLVVMTTGGNDLIHWYGRSAPREGAMYGATWQQAQPWIESFERRLHTMIDLIE